MPITLRNTIQRGLMGNEWNAEPTIYEDPDTFEIMKSVTITKIGVDNADFKTSLPLGSRVLQVGAAVQEVHHLSTSYHSRFNAISANIFKYAVNVKNFSHVFDWVEDHYYIPDGLFDTCVKAEDFSFAFNNCYKHSDSLSIPADLFANCPNVKSFAGVFGGANITKIPAGLFGNNHKAVDFSGAFCFCMKLKSAHIPSDLLAGCPNVENVSRMFEHCIFLKRVPKIFDNLQNVKDYSDMFRGCSQLSGNTPRIKVGRRLLNLWELEGQPGYPTHIDGTSCFDSCIWLKNYNDIPDDWK